jgi:hypothetical protein
MQGKNGLANRSVDKRGRSANNFAAPPPPDGRGARGQFGVRRPVSRVLSPARGPGDDHSSGTRVAASLARPTRATGPETGLPHHPHGRCRRRPYLVLLPVGFTVPPTLPPARCALAAPFHPCPQARPKPAPAGGLLSVALSLGSPPPGVTRHRVPVEPGLSSPVARAGAVIRPPAPRAT